MALEAEIRPRGTSTFEFEAEWESRSRESKLDGLSKLCGTSNKHNSRRERCRNPVEVTLTIGNDGGNTISVKAKRDD